MSYRLPLIATLGLLAVTAPADAASQLTVRGAGFGHGVGMSQYGALGFAQQGKGYREILAHYYQGTTLGSAPSRTVRVLMQTAAGGATFSNATQAGSRRLNPASSYRVTRRSAAEVDLSTSSGRRIGTFTAPLQVAGAGGSIVLGGRAINGRTGGAYRGIFEFRPGTFGINAINAVPLDQYIQGVVPVESPASWPLEALKAQAVAARTYAITTSKGGAGFEHYPDTRSQVYGGIGVEVASTNRAVAATAGQTVNYRGRPVVTYFFSTSGGRTENVENSLGGAPQPWLKSVADPTDRVSPHHRWGPIRLSLGSAGAKLSGYVKGSFRGIRVVRRGASPRIVSAEVVGTRGTTRITGATLRARFGLRDSWAYFTSVSTRAVAGIAARPGDPQRSMRGLGRDTFFGDAARAGVAASPATLTGTVLPARDGQRVTVEHRGGSGWKRVATTTVRDGAYRANVPTRGTYRAVTGGAAGPSVRVR